MEGQTAGRWTYLRRYASVHPGDAERFVTADFSRNGSMGGWRPGPRLSEPQFGGSWLSVHGGCT
jgi:hypothetical protein